MQNKTVSEILTQLMTLTTGKPVKATAEEARQIRELEEFRDKSAVDAERMKAVNEVRKREQAILTQAKGEFEATKDS
jgi:large subunit ribosomal protein MRP49